MGVVLVGSEQVEVLTMISEILTTICLLITEAEGNYELPYRNSYRK